MRAPAVGFLSVAALLAGFQEGGQQQQEEQQREAAEEAVEKFKAAYAAAGPAEEAKIRAVKDLAAVKHRKTAMALITVLASNELIGVRVAAADALGTFSDVDGVPAALVAVCQDPPNAKKPDVRKACIRALGELKARDAVSYLHAVVKKKPYDVAREAVIALGKIRLKDSIPVLIDVLREAEKTSDTAEANPLGGVPAVPGGPTVGRDLPGTSGSFPGLGGLGGYAGDEEMRREQEERRRLLREPSIKALLSITREKWTTSREWDIWWRRFGAAFAVPN